MAAGGRTELLANPTRDAQEVPLMSRAVAVIVASLLVLSVASTALAGKPSREVLDPSEPFVVSGACDFDVLVEDLKVGYAIMIWDRPDGSTAIIAAGQWQTRLTNVETGESITTVISGPEFVTIAGEDVSDVGTGRWILLNPGEGMFLVSGHMSLAFETITEVRGTLRGHSVDVCAVLAA